MKRIFTFLFVVSVLSATVWAADWATTYEENYANATKAGVTSTVKSYTRKAHPCLEWSYLKVRIKGDTLPLGKQAIWLNRNHSDVSNDVPCYLECAHIEGGVKNISFLYKQANSGDDGKIICLALKADDIRLDSIRFTGESKYRSSSRTYSKALGIKSNAKLTLQNISHTSNTDYTIIPGRLTIGALTITPYLLYRQKDVTIGTKQQGYVNRELLDNTGGTETITYLSSDETIAQVNAETGVVTPIKAGNVTISASLDGGTTTITYYTLHVVDGILCENFSKVVNQTGAASENTPWDGDLFGWTVNKARRFTNDTIYDSPRVQGTWLAENDGNVQSTNAVEGGVKHITFDWMQWSNVSSSTVKVLYGDEEKVVDAQTEISQFNHFTIDEDINGKSNAVLKISNASPSSPSDRITIGAIKITPYLLYTTKTHSMKVGDTYTNTSFIDNTESEGAITYTLEDNDSEASINPSSGAVTALAAGEVRVKATWSEGAYTTYTLAIVSRITTTASYANEIVRIGLGDELPANTLSKTDGYDGTITYSSDNDAVAIVNASTGVVTLQGGVGQVKITASLPQTDDYKAASASYNLFVRDNGSRIEMFSSVSQSGVVGETLTDWNGDLFTWQAQYQVRRGTNDTIHAGISKHQGTSIGIQNPTGTPISSILQSKDDVEGGIKYLTFYWMQWGAAGGGTRRIAVYADDDLIGYQENPRGTSGKAGDEFMLGINNAMKSNKQLIIKNESYKGSVGTLADNNCRIVLDNIYITPWLLYTNKAAQEITIGSEYTNTSLINNTAGETGTLTFSSSDESIATVDGTGKVKGKAPGNVKITAKFAWSVSEYVTTTYTIAVVPATNCETFANISKMCVVAPGANKCSETPVTDELNNGIHWTYWLGGGNTTVFGREALYLRARLTSESSADYGYLKSDKIPSGLSSLTFAWNQGGTETGVTYNVEVKVNGDIVGTITATGQSAVYATPQIFTVSELDYKGNVVIEIVNKTAYDGDKSRGRMVIDYIYWTSNAGAISLDDTADNSNVLSWNAGGAAVDVNTNRSLVADNWNTLCLPFSISKSADLDDADVQELYSAERDGDDLVVGFKALNGDELVAGTPYLVRPTSEINLTGFTNKQVILIPSAVNKGIVTLTGIFSPKALIANDKTTLFVGTPDASGNNLFYPSANGNLNGMRAYFKIDTGSSAPIRRARFVTSQTDTATGVDSQKSRAESSKAIVNGQLIIIRNGDFYDVLGRKL